MCEGQNYICARARTHSMCVYRGLEHTPSMNSEGQNTTQCFFFQGWDTTQRVVCARSRMQRQNMYARARIKTQRVYARGRIQSQCVRGSRVCQNSTQVYICEGQNKNLVCARKQGAIIQPQYISAKNTELFICISCLYPFVSVVHGCVCVYMYLLPTPMPCLLYTSPSPRD